MWGVSLALVHLGEIALARDEREGATELFEELLALGREQGNGLFVGLACLNLGLMALGQGDPGRAGALFARSLLLHQDLGLGRGTARALLGLAGVAQAKAEPNRAARLLGAGEAQLAAAGVPIPPADRRGYERTVAGTISTMGEEAFEAGRQDGRAAAPGEAIAYALEGLDGENAAGANPSGPELQSR